MKTISFILSLLVIALTAQPLLHEYFHAEISEVHCHCCDGLMHEKSTPSNSEEKKHGHDLRNSCCDILHDHTTSNASTSDRNRLSDTGSTNPKQSCCNNSEDLLNTSENHHQCDNNCHCNDCQCSISHASLYTNTITPNIQYHETGREIKPIFTFAYFFSLPDLVWHPPKIA